MIQTANKYPEFNISFHRPNGKTDGFFKNVPEPMVGQILNQLPSKWIAIVWLDGTPQTTYSI